jgi:hypothetical protein
MLFGVSGVIPMKHRFYRNQNYCDISGLAPVNQKPLVMKKMLVLLGLVAFALPTTWSSATAQGQVQIEYFYGRGNSLRGLVRLDWRMSEDTSLATILVERSNDNITFSTVGEVDPIFNGRGANYFFWDDTPEVGTNYYFLHLVFHNGEQLSDTIPVRLLAPPTINHPIMKNSGIQGNPDQPWEKGQILDITGRDILSFDGNEVDLSALPSGMYVLRTLSENGWQASLFAK